MKKKLRGFSFNENRICWRLIFKNLITHKPFPCHARSYTKFGPDRFSRFDVYWIQTDRQTEKA